MHDAAQVVTVAVNARHVGCEFLVAVHGEALLQRQLEPALAQINAGKLYSEAVQPAFTQQYPGHEASSIDLRAVDKPNGLHKRCSMRLLLTSRGR